MKKLCWLILVWFLMGCGGEAVPTATAVPPQPPVAETTAEPEVSPTDTAVPPQSTDTPPPATFPPRPQPPTVAPSPVPSEVPALVWLPYATGNFGQSVLMMEDGDIAHQEMPVEVEIYFDYKAGWLAYGSYFWEPTADRQSVTDLHIYNFATGTDQLWAESNIGRVALSPANEIADQPTAVAAIHSGQGFDLVVMAGPDNNTLLVEDIDPYFSWSPDGEQIAYLKDGELFITAKADDSANPPIASGVYAGGGWIGDAPLWLGSSGYLLYADNPFAIVAADGSETMVPLTEDGAVLQGPRPLAMLYSATNDQLIAESQGMFGSIVTIYQLGKGFKTAVPTQQTDDAQLAGWYEENESAIIVRGGEPTILPLTPPE